MKVFDQGDRLRALRENAGLTQKQVAEMLGVSESAVSEWERNLSAIPSKRLRKMAKIYKTSTDYILNVEYGRRVIVLDEDINDVEYEMLQEITAAAMASIKKARGRR